MAGKKITELPELGTTPAAGDWLVVVDVSDTSESAEGTTKKVLTSDAITSNASSGTYALVLEAGTGVSSVTSIGTPSYIQIDNFVQGTIRVQSVLSSSEAAFLFSLPVLPPVFTYENQLNCTLGSYSPTDEYSTYEARSVASEQKGIVHIIAAGTVTIDMVITFNYFV